MGEAAEVPRIPSGVPYLDPILGGGWLRGGVYVIAGPPGTGKTTLGNQFCYAAADRGENAVYVTLLTETHDRMLLHLRSLEFFRPQAVGDRVTYVGAMPELREGGYAAVLALITRTVRERKARVLVLDGLPVLEESASSSTEVRTFLQGLAARMALNDCTALLLGTQTAKGTEASLAMADGIVALGAELQGLKAVRGLEVIKLRGSENIAGKHTFEIDHRGLRVHPRWEAWHRKNSQVVADPDHRLSTGIPSLDVMCGGGLIENSSTVLMGSPGAGKTLIGLHFLAEGARRGEKALYLGYAEGPGQLIRKGRDVGLDLQTLVDAGTMQLETRAPVETLPDAVALELLEMIDRQGTRRLFIDGLEPLAREALDPERTPRFVSALLNTLRDHHVTVVATQQTNELFGPVLQAPVEGIEAIVDNLILIRFSELEGRYRRIISVMKMRDSPNDPDLRHLEISDRGVAVGSALGPVAAVSTGQPHRVGEEGGAGR